MTVDLDWAVRRRGASGPTEKRQRSVCRPLVVAAVGLTPILSLALSILDVLPLHLGGPLLVGGGVTVALWLHVLRPGDGRRTLEGLLAGLVAVLIYDCTRLPFVVVGNWPDFIPEIGAWLTNRPQAHWSIGYLWRYLGNGAGMGLAFTMAIPLIEHRIDRRLAGIVYGLTIWSGLLLTLLIADDGQAKLFQLTPITVAVSLTGHLVYGGILGLTAPGRSGGPGPSHR